MIKQYTKVDEIIGSLLVLSGIRDASYGEIVLLKEKNGKTRKAKLIKIEDDKVVAQVFEGSSGLSQDNTLIEFTGKAFEIPLDLGILGRVFNGVGETIDGGGKLYSSKSYNINGRPMNPVARTYPRDYIQTGISTIDSLITLIRGQKLPIFSGSGLPHNELAAQIATQASLPSLKDEKFAVVFAAIGVKNDDAQFFKTSFEEAGISENVVMFQNLADDPVVERISTPRCALTAAEYLAFQHDYQVLVIMTDITSYCEALRELASQREEVPSRKGYPGYLYSDLASLYERAGRMKGKSGSITFLPILTMPGDDISHPIPDLTGYITEGQIVLSRNMYSNNIYPPINVLPSLSRLMKDGIGEGFTREDHPELATQIFTAYSRVQDVLSLSQIVGEDELSEIDRKYLEFGRKFDDKFVSQSYETSRNISETIDLMWELLSILPKNELSRIDQKYIDKYYIER